LIIEEVVVTGALAALVVEDLDFAPLDPGTYTAQLSSTSATPYYKPGGFFVFVDIPAGSNTLQIGGGDFQEQSYTVSIPGISPPFYEEGANDLIVIVTALNGGTSNITFAPIVIATGIDSGATVEANGFSTTLATELDPGQITQAKLTTLGTLAVGSIVRIVRNPALRLKYSPYYSFPNPVTQIIGTVTAGTSGIGLEGVQMSLVSVAGTPVNLSAVGAANVATLVTGTGTIVLGTSRDVTTLTNSNGDFHFYFNLAQPAGSTVIQASIAGYTTQTLTVTASAWGRTRADFQLATA
jgi:hypothetical protein